MLTAMSLAESGMTSREKWSQGALERRRIGAGVGRGLPLGDDPAVVREHLGQRRPADPVIGDSDALAAGQPDDRAGKIGVVADDDVGFADYVRSTALCLLRRSRHR